jgi:hypothetical protein
MKPNKKEFQTFTTIIGKVPSDSKMCIGRSTGHIIDTEKRPIEVALVCANSKDLTLAYRTIFGREPEWTDYHKVAVVLDKHVTKSQKRKMPPTTAM